MKKRNKSLLAFSLVEVTMALGIAVVCLASIFALLAAGIGSEQISIAQTQGTNLLTSIAADLKSTPQTVSPNASTNSLIYGITIPTNIVTSVIPTATVTTNYITTEGVTNSLTATPPPRYQLTAWVTPGSSTNATLVRLLLTWPAQAAITNAQGSLETVVALNRNP